MLDVLKKIFFGSRTEREPDVVSIKPDTLPLPSIDSLGDVRGKCVLLRASLNVPVKDGKVVSAFRLMGVLPTLTYLKERGARVILLGHIGREKDESLKPVFDALTNEVPLKALVPLTKADMDAATRGLTDGEVLMLENVRGDEGEETNNAAFSQLLASVADLYVNDAFADSHRAHASIVGIPKLLPSCFGQTFIKEYEALKKAMLPMAPALLILGGAKFETKLPLIEKYAAVYDHVFVGGALANDMFKAKGYEVGTSLVSKGELSLTTLLRNEKILLPIDVTVQGPEGVRIAAPEDVQEDESMLDVGPATIAMLHAYTKEAETILWNGPLGNYEAGFSAYTEACARLVGESDAYSVIGGGDTIATIESLGLSDQFGFLSTAGGAMLTFLESGTLPGIEAITQK